AIRQTGSLRCVLALCAASTFAATDDGYGPAISVPREVSQSGSAIERSLVDQTWDDVRHKTAGCIECHKGIENPSMHASRNVVLGCTDCHGGNSKPGLTIL